MATAFHQALTLISSGNDQLLNIIGVTLRMSLLSSLLALLLGAPLGFLLGKGRFPGRRALLVMNRALMGLPPVVCGLFCYMLFSGVGPLRHLKLLFTVKAMVVAQVILLTPLVAGNTEAFAAGLAEEALQTARGLRLSNARTFLLMMNECRYQLVSVYLLGFSRAIAEVGAVSMVGGAIAYKTNVMTTAIMMYTNRGDFTLGVALGLILLLLALLLNAGVYLLQAVLDR